LNLKTSKRNDLIKVAKIFKLKIDEGYWFICTDDVKKSLNIQFALYDVSYVMSEDKCINIDINKIKNITNKQKINSYDDISQFLK